MERLDLSKLADMLTSLEASIDTSARPPRLDTSTVDADTLHDNDLVVRGSNRYLVAGNVKCDCSNGYVFKRVENRPMAVPCPNCYELTKGLHRIQRAHLPNDAYDSALCNYIPDSTEQETIIRDMLMYSKPSIPPSLFMHGGAGNGKSTISYILAKHLCLSGYNVKYIHHYHAFQEEKKGWGDGRDYLNSLVDNVDILIFDEFGGLGGRSRYSEWFMYTTVELLGILYEKYKAGQLCIIMTSNMDPKDIYNKLLDRNDMALSRLQNIFGNPLHMTGPDRRPKGNQVSSWIK